MVVAVVSCDILCAHGGERLAATWSASESTPASTSRPSSTRAGGRARRAIARAAEIAGGAQ